MLAIWIFGGQAADTLLLTRHSTPHLLQKWTRFVTLNSADGCTIQTQ